MRTCLVQYGLAKDKRENFECPLSTQGWEDVARCVESRRDLKNKFQ